MAPSLDYWRGFFRGAGASIFDAIEAAILVAAADHPAGLRASRDAIAECLYTALLVPAPQPPPPPGGPAAAPPPHPLLPEGAASVPSLCSSDRAEVITDDAAPRHREDPVAAEALRIKAVLLDTQEKSEAELLELLRRLQQLEFTVKALEVTEIGKAVSGLRKHSSKQIRQLVRSLIEGWKSIVDEWMNTGDAIVDHTPQSMNPTNHTPQSMNPSGLEQGEVGLASPPMDEAGLFATPTTAIQLSELLDGVDDDGNVRNTGKEGGWRYPVNQEPVRKPPSQRLPTGQRYDAEQNWRQDQSMMRMSRLQEPIYGQMRQQFFTGMQTKASNMETGPGRPQRPPIELKGSDMMRSKQQQDAAALQRRPQSTPPDKPMIHHDENSVRAKLELAKNAKLEATKRKLQEGYQEFDNAKKQRTIQMVDPQDIPKQGNRNWQPSPKPRNNNTTTTNTNRSWPSMRH